MNKRIEIMSVEFTTENETELIALIDERIKANKKTTIFTPNPQMLIKSKKDPELLSLLRHADINIPDGIGIVAASRILKKPIQKRISGIDLGEKILELATERGYSVFLLGGKPLIADLAAENIRKKFQAINICGTHHGYFQSSKKDELWGRIAAADPDIIFVCLGFPLQEKWIIENLPSLPSVKLAVGLGGSLDVWSGRIKRAPEFVQHVGMEWLWRAIREPKRLKIFIDIPIFMKEILKQKSVSR